MQLADAKLAVDQILNEERQRPTVWYEDVANEWGKRLKEMTPQEIVAWTPIISVPRKNLLAQRQEYPRPVTETPHIFKFSSTNFDLLMTVYGQVNETERPQLIDHVLRRVESGGTNVAHKPENYFFPTFAGTVCELPLVVEFCVRTGSVESLFAAAAKAKMPTNSLALMMMQLEETIALNWDLFSNKQLAQIRNRLTPLYRMAELQTHSRSVQRHVEQIVRSFEGIVKECEQARFWYLKGALQRTVNVEVESDKATVESSLTKLGFSADMVAALNAAENDYRSTTNPFELKSCLGHIRSFLEHLHREAAKSIAATAGESVEDRWGSATSYLRKQGYLTQQHEAFVTSLYTLISDTSVHPLCAEREYARLLRNVVIEYGVMFLAVLIKKEVKVS